MSISQPASDAELLALLSRDVAAFEAFYDRYVDQVAAFAAKRCDNPADVADSVAQTFVQLLLAAPRFDPDKGEAGAFLFGIAGNVVRQIRRKGARHRALVWKLSGRDLLDHDDVERIDAAIDAANTAAEVQKLLDAVPPSEQQMLQLVADGMTPGQASVALGISPDAGWARLSRARRRLRTRITNPEGANHDH